MYIENPDEEENKSQSSSSPSVGAGGGGASVGTGGTSTNPTGGNPSTIQSIQPNQPNQSFATVQDYLKANQQQGEDFGNKFVSTVGQSLGQNKSDIDTSAQNVQNQITSGTVNASPDLISTALKSPTDITGDANKLAEFQKEYNAQYTGPSSFESSDQYTNAANAANAASQTGAELGSTGGREQLLQDQFGVYGQGNKGLDQTLLQNSSAYPNVPALAQSYNSVQDYLKAAANNTNNAVTNATNTTAATKTAATAPFANNLTTFQTGLNAKVQAAKDNAQTVADKYQVDINAAGKNPGNAATFIDDLTKEGASPTEVKTVQDYLAGLRDYQMTGDLTSFATLNPNADVTPANVATPEDYANAAAYQQLTGVNYGGVLNPANANQPSTAPKAFDTSGLISYLKGQVTPRDKQLLGGNLSNAVSKAFNMPSTMDWKQMILRNPGMAQQAATEIIDAAKRSNGASQLVSLYNEAKNDWDANVSWYRDEGVPFNPVSAGVQGQQAFLNSLGKFLGKPQI